MSRLSDALVGGGKLVCYLTAGFPTKEQSIAHALACVEGGVDVLEIGVPFSDPVADGRVIQYTSHKALQGGMTPLKVFELVRALREHTDVPVVLVACYNPIFQIGEGRYVRLCSESGVNGLIVPDLPLEESATLGACCRDMGVDLVQLVGPTTSEARMRRIATSSSGFLYVVSSMGTTGARASLSERTGEVVRRAKGCAGGLPLGVGFGVSRPDQVEMLYRQGVDAVIVGSALLQRVIEGASPEVTRGFVANLRGPEASENRTAARR
jgi:tryptophan synthase alpha chain